MNNFVAGQKVKCVDNSNISLDKNRIYLVNDVNLNGNITLKDVYSKDIYYLKDRFKTIIQSFDDVVVGMMLTWKETDKKYKVNLVGYDYLYLWYNYDYYKCHNLNVFKEYEPIIKSCDNCKHYDIVVCLKKDGMECNHHKTWRSWEMKNKEIKKEDNMNKEYEVIKPFRISDLYKCRPFSCKEWEKEFEELLEEENIRNFRTDHIYESFNDIKYSVVLMKEKNLKWLCEKGFIKEVEKDIELKIGIVLKETLTNREYYIVSSDKEDLFLMPCGGNNYNKRIYTLGNRFKIGCKLSELNKDKVFGYFEVVNE